MFEARLAQGRILKGSLDAIKDMVTEANFDCNPGGISLQAMDSSHVSLVSLLLRNDAFESYRCERPVNLGLNLTVLGKVLKCATNEDAITLSTQDDSPDAVKFCFESNDQERTSEYDIKLMDIDAEQLGIPEQQFDATVKMPSVEFQRICRDLGTMSENVTITVTKEGVKFSAQGENSTGAVKLRQGGATDKKPEEQISIELQQAVSLTFAIKYLSNFTKATTLTPQVCLHMASDTPLVVEYRMAEIGYIKYYLAPKIEDDEGASQ
eukprot:Clim_evm31s202 gene=Clim_evmTU31s202